MPVAKSGCCLCRGRLPAVLVKVMNICMVQVDQKEKTQ